MDIIFQLPCINTRDASTRSYGKNMLSFVRKLPDFQEVVSFHIPTTEGRAPAAPHRHLQLVMPCSAFWPH